MVNLSSQHSGHQLNAKSTQLPQEQIHWSFSAADNMTNLLWLDGVGHKVVLRHVFFLSVSVSHRGRSLQMNTTMSQQIICQW